MKLLDESKIENPTPVCLSLLEVDSILRSLNCQISPYSGIDHKRARTVIDLKLKYTRKIIKKHNENTLEGLSEIISTLHRDQGIIPLDLYTKYENRKQSSEWYAYAIEIVNSNSNSVNNHKQAFDPLFKWENLSHIPLNVLEEVTEKGIKIKTIEGYEASRLMYLLSRARWESESKIQNEEYLVDLGVRFENYLKT